jgi:hypothetical protein
MFYKDAHRERLRAIVPGLMDECKENRKEVVIRLTEISQENGDMFSDEELARLVCEETGIDFDLVLQGKDRL